MGLKEDARGKCQGNPPNPAVTEGDGFPRVSFSGDCGNWRVNPEKVKLPDNDPLQKRIDSGITELEKFLKEHIRRTFEFQNPSIQQVEGDPTGRRFKHIIAIFNGAVDPEKQI
jgi:hypothetical protein